MWKGRVCEGEGEKHVCSEGEGVRHVWKGRMCEGEGEGVEQCGKGGYRDPFWYLRESGTLW